MKCGNYINISRYVDGELDENTSRSVEAHFKDCEECCALLAFFRSVKGLPKISAPADITSKIMANIDKPGFAQTFLFHLTNLLDYIMHPVTLPVMAVAAIVVFLAVSNPPKSDFVKVMFTVPYDNAKTVSLAGDFNNWDPQKGRLKRKGDAWSGAFYIKPGRYEYMVIIDDKIWIPDPAAKEYVSDGYGSKNSLLDTTKL